MTGWRIGYLVGEPQVIAAASKLQSQSTSNPCTISQWAAVTALTGDQECVRTMVATLDERRRYTLDRLAKIPGITCPRPTGAFYTFPNVSAYYGKNVDGGVIEDSLDFSDYLMESVHLATIPGIAFGEDHCIRISYVLSMEDLKEGFDRLTSALVAL